MKQINGLKMSTQKWLAGNEWKFVYYNVICRIILRKWK